MTAAGFGLDLAPVPAPFVGPPEPPTDPTARLRAAEQQLRDRVAGAQRAASPDPADAWLADPNNRKAARRAARANPGGAVARMLAESRYRRAAPPPGIGPRPGVVPDFAAGGFRPPADRMLADRMPPDLKGPPPLPAAALRPQQMPAELPALARGPAAGPAGGRGGDGGAEAVARAVARWTTEAAKLEALTAALGRFVASAAELGKSLDEMPRELDLKGTLDHRHTGTVETTLDPRPDAERVTMPMVHDAIRGMVPNAESPRPGWEGRRP
jgi:hypothetical protein